MLEVRRILAPTDFSKHSEVAVDYARGLAERLGSTLVMLHVLPDVVPAGPDLMLAPTLPPEFYQESEARSLEALENMRKPEWGTALRLETAVRWGGAVEGIVDFASDQAVDLIVISTHGRTGLTHVLLGSVAERIVREAPCPVLTVREQLA